MAILTTEQFNEVKTIVIAEPSLAVALATGADYLVKAWLDTATSTIVWKSSVQEKDIMLAFDWTRVDNLSVGKARIWEWMFKNGAADPSRPNIRAGIDATWVGTQADLDVRAAVYTKCRRPATNLEAILSTGTGTDVSPATMEFEGTIDVETAGKFKLA